MSPIDESKNYAWFILIFSSCGHSNHEMKPPEILIRIYIPKYRSQTRTLGNGVGVHFHVAYMSKKDRLTKSLPMNR